MNFMSEDASGVYMSMILNGKFSIKSLRCADKNDCIYSLEFSMFFDFKTEVFLVGRYRNVFGNSLLTIFEFFGVFSMARCIFVRGLL